MSANEGSPPPGAGPSEEELRAAYEAELARITATDMIAQAAVSLLNVGAHRMGPPPGQEAHSAEAGGRDLEQVRDAIDAARALLEILQRRIPQEIAPLRDALSRLQMAYAAEIGTSAEASPSSGSTQTSTDPQQPSAATHEPQPGQRGDGPGPAESSGRLWVPGR